MDHVAIAKHVLRATDGDADIFFAQHAGRLDRCDAVLGNVVDTVIDMQFHPCAHADRVEVNAGNAADQHAGDGHLAAFGQSADVIEVGRQLVAAGAFLHGQPADLDAQPGHRQDAGQHEGTDNDFDIACLHQSTPNMTAVSRKSSASTASDEYTTVRVVAAAMPSEVGTTS